MDSNYVFLFGIMWWKFGQKMQAGNYSGLPILGIQIRKHWPGRCLRKESVA